MVTQSVTLKINAKDESRAAFASLNNHFKGFGAKAKGVFSKLKNDLAGAFGGGGMAASGALGGIVSGIGYAVHEADKYRVASAGLRASLKAIGPAAAQTLPQLQAYAGHLQDMTTMSRNQIMAVEQMGASMGKFSGGALQTVTKDALGFAAAYGTSATSAMRLFSEVAKGGTISLSRYGIVLPKNATAQQKFNALLDIGSKRFGEVTAKVNTVGGAMTQLKNSFDDFMATAGKPVMIELVKLIHWAQTNFLAFQNSMTTYLAVIDYTFMNWKTVLKIVFYTAAYEITKFTNVIAYEFGTVIPTWLNWFGQNWKTIFKNLWSYTTTVFNNLTRDIGTILYDLPELISGKLSFSEIWKPLTSGLKQTLIALPKIAARHAGPLETALKESAARASASYARGIAYITAQQKTIASNLKPSTAPIVPPGLQPEAKAPKVKKVHIDKIKEHVEKLKKVTSTAAKKTANLIKHHTSTSASTGTGTVSGMVNTQYLTGVGIAAKEHAENPQVMQQRQTNQRLDKTNQHLATVVTALNKIHEKLGMTKVSIGAGLSMAGVSA